MGGGYLPWIRGAPTLDWWGHLLIYCALYYRYEFESRVLRGDETFSVKDTVTVQSKPVPQVNRVEKECYTKTELFRQKFNIEDRRGEVEIKVTVESGTGSIMVKRCSALKIEGIGMVIIFSKCESFITKLQAVTHGQSLWLLHLLKS